MLEIYSRICENKLWWQDVGNNSYCLKAKPQKRREKNTTTKWVTLIPEHEYCQIISFLKITASGEPVKLHCIDYTALDIEMILICYPHLASWSLYLKINPYAWPLSLEFSLSIYISRLMDRYTLHMFFVPVVLPLLLIQLEIPCSVVALQSSIAFQTSQYSFRIIINHHQNHREVVSNQYAYQ